MHASLWRRLAPWLFGLLTLLAVVLVGLHFSSIEQFVRLARNVRPEWFLLACVAQIATFVSSALVWHLALRHAGHPRRLISLIPLGLAKQFMDQMVPSGGISGAILVAGGLTRRHVPANVVMATLLVGLVAYFAAYLFSALISLFVLWRHERSNPALVVLVAIFVATIVAIPAGVLWMQQRAHRVPASWVRWLPGGADLLKAVSDAPTDLLRDPLLLLETVLLEVVGFALDALTLWLAFFALGEAPALWVAFVSFIVASMVATLGPIPLGLGTFEAACVAMLSLLGVAIEAALAATLLLRGLSFWLPMIPGLWLARREVVPE